MYNVLIKNAYAALNVDAMNRTAKCASSIANGSVFTLDTYSTEADEKMVWVATAPAAATATGIWMASSPEVVITELPDGTKMKGIDNNIRDFVNLAGEPIDAFKPAVGDILTFVFADDTSYKASGADYIGIDAGEFTLKALNSAPASGFYAKKVATTVAHIGNGNIVKTPVAAYKYEVKAN